MTASGLWKTAPGIIALLLSVASAGHAQDWAKGMFDHTTHNFGVVARGAKVEHRFIIENSYEEDAHIKSVESSCGCTKAQVNRQLLKSWEKAEVLVAVDTRTFLGQKDATIKVVFDLPFAAEVQLHVHTYIRSDIVVQPGAVLFGSLAQGTGALQTLAVKYAGRDDWRIAKVECANPSIETVATETNRSPGKVDYSLSVRLKPDAPPGYIRDQVVLVTNDLDMRSARVPVSIEGLVIPALSVRPSPLLLGTAEAGKPAMRNLVVQGRAPFRILSIRSSDERFQCAVPTETKAAHVLSVTFLSKDGKASPGVQHTKIRIETDLAGAKVVEVDASVQMAPVESGQK
jgi:hypothetical protein